VIQINIYPIFKDLIAISSKNNGTTWVTYLMLIIASIFLGAFIFRKYLTVINRPQFEKIISSKEIKLMDTLIFALGNYLLVLIYVFGYAYFASPILQNNKIFKTTVNLLSYIFILIIIVIIFHRILIYIKERKNPNYRMKSTNQFIIKKIGLCFTISSALLYLAIAIETCDYIRTNVKNISLDFFVPALFFPAVIYYILNWYLKVIRLPLETHYVVTKVSFDDIKCKQLFFQYSVGTYLIMSSIPKDYEHKNFYVYNMNQDIYLNFKMTNLIITK
jgi:hypothetical protein